MERRREEEREREGEVEKEKEIGRESNEGRKRVKEGEIDGVRVVERRKEKRRR